jgi:putative peptide zinc metalloprotease protein
MADSLFSPSWYRVAGLKPRMRSHVEIHRHHYRGELWYVLEDHASSRYGRFTPAAYQIIGLMDGKRTVQEIWDAARDRLGEETPTQEEVIRLLSQLHAMDALQADVMPDTAEIMKRFEKKRSARWKQNLRSPLFMRFHLFDADRFLTRFQGVAGPFFSWPGFVIWVIVVGAAVFLAGVHWAELTENITDRILNPGNLVVMWLVFPVLKAFHEFGHGFAVKLKGGEVHDMGIMFLVLTPVPYVDASASSAFREKRERILVGAAGMAVEIFIGALALFLWASAEPGPMRSLAYNVIFIAGVSSILFNGNALLRYDAYYILSDLLEIPNLGPRGLRYAGYLFQRYLFGVREAEPPESTPGERIWFILYTVASWAYRIFIYVAIVLFIASKFFFIGVLFAIWAAVSMMVMPAAKGLKFLSSSPRLSRKRTRSVLVIGLLLVVIAVVIFLVPFPLGTRAEGVLWVPEHSFVRAGTEGFVDELLAKPGSRVKTGDPLIQCSDPLLPAQIRVLESKMEELQATYDAQIIAERVKADITKEEMQHITGKLKDAKEREGDLTIRSPASGVFIVPVPQDLPGRYAKRGELLGYVLDPAAVTGRVVVYQEDVDFVRSQTRKVQVRLPENIPETVSANLLREVPAATDQLPGRALTQEGGGKIAIDPRDRLGIKAFQKVFLFDIELPTFKGLYNVGGRLYVRFDHGYEPIVYRWYREVRQVFLRRFNV